MTAATPSAAACPDCRALIPSTMEDRSKHREWHADLAAKHRGVQKRIAELAEVATRAADAAATATRDVRGIEIPEPVEPMRIEEWPADEYEPEQQSQYIDDEPYDEHAATRADAEAAFANVPPAIDRDDDGYFTSPRPA